MVYGRKFSPWIIVYICTENHNFNHALNLNFKLKKLRWAQATSASYLIWGKKKIQLLIRVYQNNVLIELCYLKK